MIKTLALIIFSLIILYIYNALILTVILLVLLTALKLIKTKRPVLARLKILLPVGLLIIVFQLIFNPSPSWLQRFLFGYIVFLRITIVSFSVLFFMSVTSLSEIVSAFSFLPKNLQLVLTMTFYFIPSILDESEKIVSVQKSRGLKVQFWNITPLIIPLLHRVFKRSETLALSIVSRGYEE